MGFLKKSKVPGELPDLAIADTGNSFDNAAKAVEAPKPLAATSTALHHTVSSTQQLSAPTAPMTPKPITVQGHTSPKESETLAPPSTTEVYEQHMAKEVEQAPKEIKKEIEINLGEEEESFFDQVLEDINGEIRDLGKLEDWYKNKFQTQDVVSNMKTYWEGNKADVIIRSFGSEYKEKINTHIRKLQKLESEWRSTYFDLVKKEEEMKKEERILKETLSDFVDLCKRRKSDGKKTSKK